MRSDNVVAMPAPRLGKFVHVEPPHPVRHKTPREEKSFNDIPCFSSSLQFYDDAPGILTCVRGEYSGATGISLNQCFYIPKICSEWSALGVPQAKEGREKKVYSVSPRSRQEANG